MTRTLFQWWIIIIPVIGRTVSHYRILSPLGTGGMGVVYAAEDVRLGRPVAVKFVSADLVHSEEAVQRLRSEARAASALNHANICTIYDIGEVDGHPFIVMELLKGESLRDRLARGALRVHQVLDIGIEVADALHSAHSAGILHRDVKPANIFVTDHGAVKLLDFGLAKLTPHIDRSSPTMATAHVTVAGVTLGTISHMSPEQVAGDELDGRSDIFSLGLVLYECATGQHPFPGRTSTAILAAILNKTPVPPIERNPDLPVHLHEVILNCLEKDRELRYQSAADVRADLKRLRRDLDSGQTRTADVASSGRTPRASERRSWRWPAVAAAIATIAAAGWYIASPGNLRDTPTPTRATTSTTAAAPAATNAEDAERQLALAQGSFRAGNYRSAAAYAREVLARAPDNVEARRIRDEADTLVARFEAAVANARQRIARGDLSGASQALEAARRLDPTAPGLLALSSQLADKIRVKDARAAESSRPAPKQSARQQPEQVDERPAVPPAPAASAAAPASQLPPEKPRVSEVPSSPTVAPSIPPAAPAPVPSGALPPEQQPSKPPSVRVAPASPAPPVVDETASERDERAIRQLVASYARAIETKDMALFRALKPNLSGQEEQRLQEGFRAVTSQRVNLSIVSIDRRGDSAIVALKRHDTIQAGGRQQTVDSQQTLRLSRGSGGWVIVEIR
jgi:serine/threonine protein kinase/ketosteroid isomerase-like protein